MKLSDNARKVFNYLNEHGPARNDRIAAYTGVNTRSVGLCCTRLREMELIEFHKGKWRLTFRGKMVDPDTLTIRKF